LSIVHRVMVFWQVQISKQYTPALYQGSTKCSLSLLFIIIIIIIIIIGAAVINSTTQFVNTIP